MHKKEFEMNYLGLDGFIQNALMEDIGAGDVTTLNCVPKERRSKGVFVAKEDGVLCGVDILGRVFEMVDKDIKVAPLFSDGDGIKKGDRIAEIEGPSRGVLMGERVALNLIQLLSGIATRTAGAVEAVEGTQARISDTRKTTPGMRALEKYAVRVGGGTNHRFNLADGVLIKDNHIVAGGGIERTVNSVRARIPHTMKIEVETANMEQVEEAVRAKADIIMLDNMSLEQMAEAVKFINGRALVEASGNMGDKDLLKVASTGVDLISVGALTHTIKALDISLVFTE